MVPVAIEKNNGFNVTLINVELAMSLRIPLMMFLRECDLMVDATVAGVNEESRVRR